MNINDYIPILINMKEGVISLLSLAGAVTRSWLLVVGAGQTQDSCHMADTLGVSGGRLHRHYPTSARFIAWCLRHPLFRGILMGPKAFLEPRGVSGLWPGARTHLKMAL